MLNRLEECLRHRAIENLTVYLVAITGIFSGTAQFGLFALQFPAMEVLFSSNWWHVLAYPFCFTYPGDNTGWIWLFFRLYMLWMFGSSLEHQMGAARYNLYIFFGIAIVTLSQLLINSYWPFLIRSDFIYLSIFLAHAWLFPDESILIFFILPVKIKWIALLMIAVTVFSAVREAILFSPIYLAIPIITFANFMLFYGRDILHRAGIRNKKFRQLKSIRIQSIHRCEICGITEKDDALMDFRFCVGCLDHEYCRNHLHNHEHIVA